jgi:hypothetical protein
LAEIAGRAPPPDVPKQRPRGRRFTRADYSACMLERERVAFVHPSCPAVCRASTSLFDGEKEDVDGRDKPGHDASGRSPGEQGEPGFASQAETPSPGSRQSRSPGLR